jgi:hypothetical protein
LARRFRNEHGAFLNNGRAVASGVKLKRSAPGGRFEECEMKKRMLRISVVPQVSKPA